MKKKRSLIRRVFDPEMLLHDFIIATGIIPTSLYLRHKRIYLNGKKPKGLFSGKYIISSNHMSLLDPIIVCEAFWFRRVGFLATKTLFKNKLLSFILRHAGVVPVDKENPSLAEFKKLQEHLDRGHIVCFFPEGAVTREALGAFKSGILMLASMAECDILPTFLVQRKSKWHRQVIVIGEKIKISDYFSGPFPTIEDIEKVTEVLKEKELELENKYKELYGDK